MDDKLEKYIQEHRPEMDVETPPNFIWHKIKSKGLDRPANRDWIWIWKAASVLFFLASAALLYILVQQDRGERLYSLGDISDEYAQVESQYESSIEAITASIDFNSIEEDELGWLVSELKYLDQINAQFRKDINENVDKEKLVKVLVDYYEKKIKILKKIELEINRNNNEKLQNISI